MVLTEEDYERVRDEEVKKLIRDVMGYKENIPGFKKTAKKASNIVIYI